MSKLILKEQGEANQYCIIDEDGKWVIGLIANGEMTVHSQSVTMRRIVACLNACEPLSIESLEKYGLAGITSSVEESLRRKVEELTAELQFLRPMKASFIEQQVALAELGLVLERTQELIKRARHWEEGKIGLHDTKEDICAALKGAI